MPLKDFNQQNDMNLVVFRKITLFGSCYILGELEAGKPSRVLFGELVRRVGTGFRLTNIQHSLTSYSLSGLICKI